MNAKVPDDMLPVNLRNGMRCTHDLYGGVETPPFQEWNIEIVGACGAEYWGPSGTRGGILR
jgi:hypothetical protein